MSAREEVFARLDALDAKLDRVLVALNSGSQEEERLLTVAQLADRLGVSRDYLYDHADDFGAIRLGDGKRSHLRFPSDVVTARLTSNRSHEAESPVVNGETARRKRAPNGTRPEWRPIHAPKGSSEG